MRSQSNLYILVHAFYINWFDSSRNNTH